MASLLQSDSSVRDRVLPPQKRNACPGASQRGVYSSHLSPATRRVSRCPPAKSDVLHSAQFGKESRGILHLYYGSGEEYLQHVCRAWTRALCPNSQRNMEGPREHALRGRASSLALEAGMRVDQRSRPGRQHQQGLSHFRFYPFPRNYGVLYKPTSQSPVYALHIGMLTCCRSHDSCEHSTVVAFR